MSFFFQFQSVLDTATLPRRRGNMHSASRDKSSADQDAPPVREEKSDSIRNRAAMFSRGQCLDSDPCSFFCLVVCWLVCWFLCILRASQHVSAAFCHLSIFVPNAFQASLHVVCATLRQMDFHGSLTSRARRSGTESSSEVLPDLFLNQQLHAVWISL